MSRYDWDDVKAEANVRKHGITFAEAESVLRSPFAKREPDVGHFTSEERVKVIGWSSQGALLVVIVSVGGAKPRIISARRASKRERHAYETRS